jgi:hypothetical protein
VYYHPGGLSQLDAMTDTDYARSVLQLCLRGDNGRHGLATEARDVGELAD